MRAELSAAMRGLIASADPAAVYTPLSDDETAKLVRLAAFTARARTSVERDGYSGDLLVMPQPEGPARLVKALRRLYGALGALGVDDKTPWAARPRYGRRSCAHYWAVRSRSGHPQSRPRSAWSPRQRIASSTIWRSW